MKMSQNFSNISTGFPVLFCTAGMPSICGEIPRRALVADESHSDSQGMHREVQARGRDSEIVA